MKKINLTSSLVLLALGTLTAFLWIPLLPLIVPLVTVTIAMKWASAALLGDTHQAKNAFHTKVFYFPISTTNNGSQSQGSQTAAWPSSASSPSPARADSLPPSRQKNFKRQLRESRQVARVLNGLDLRRPTPAHGF